MALSKYPECGSMISDKSEKCPHCGIPAKYFGISSANNGAEIDYSQLGNLLISFDSDYCRIFAIGHYVTHRDLEYFKNTYSEYNSRNGEAFYGCSNYTSDVNKRSNQCPVPRDKGKA